MEGVASSVKHWSGNIGLEYDSYVLHKRAVDRSIYVRLQSAMGTLKYNGSS